MPHFMVSVVTRYAVKADDKREAIDKVKEDLNERADTAKAIGEDNSTEVDVQYGTEVTVIDEAMVSLYMKAKQ